MLSRLIYASRETRQFANEDIDQILAASRRNNLKDGVTGMLCHGDGRFLQYLEGDKTAVQSIYDRIAGDERHTDVILIEQVNAERRIFGDWSMGFVDVNDMLTNVTLPEAGRMDEFHPEKLDAATAMQLIKNLKTNLSGQVIID